MVNSVVPPRFHTRDTKYFFLSEDRNRVPKNPQKRLGRCSFRNASNPKGPSPSQACWELTYVTSCALSNLGVNSEQVVSFLTSRACFSEVKRWTKFARKWKQIPLDSHHVTKFVTPKAHCEGRQYRSIWGLHLFKRWDCVKRSIWSVQTDPPWANVCGPAQWDYISGRSNLSFSAIPLRRIFHRPF